MPTHIEQPGSRHSKPARRKMRSSPSASACAFTKPEPGTTMAGYHGAPAVRDLCRRAQILDPAIGAGANKDPIDGDLRQRTARC